MCSAALTIVTRFVQWFSKHKQLLNHFTRINDVNYQKGRVHCLKKGIKQNITKTHLYNSDPLKPYFYIVKLGFTGGYIIFLISAQNRNCRYSLEPPRRGGAEAVLTSTHSLCFEQKYEKYQYFSSENFHFVVVKFSVYLNRHIFVMIRNKTGKQLIRNWEI